MSDFPFNILHCKGDEIAEPTIQTRTPQSVEFNCCGTFCNVEIEQNLSLMSFCNFVHQRRTKHILLQCAVYLA